MPREISQLLYAISFACRAHDGQVRKDGVTPYASHPYRVTMILQNLFCVSDIDVLTAAVLHDTIEDTTTDFDDLAAEFGNEIAGWVAALSKDKRLPYDAREKAYCQSLTRSGWQVQVCKLADIFDNLTDIRQFEPKLRREKAGRLAEYLKALRSDLEEPAQEAFELTAKLYEDVQASLSSGTDK